MLILNTNIKKGITPDSSYLESFFEKLIGDSALNLKTIPENIMQKSPIPHKPKLRKKHTNDNNEIKL